MYSGEFLFWKAAEPFSEIHERNVLKMNSRVCSVGALVPGAFVGDTVTEAIVVVMNVGGTEGAFVTGAETGDNVGPGVGRLVGGVCSVGASVTGAFVGDKVTGAVVVGMNVGGVEGEFICITGADTGANVGLGLG
jgi:hypothetical protein